MPNKDEIADTLESIGQLLELKGENAFKTRAYANAARTLETYPGNIEAMAREGRLAEIAGIGEAIAAKITELVTTGRLEYYEKLRAEFPETLFDLFELQGVGPKKIKALYDQLGVKSIPDLEAACKDGRAAALPGFGDKSAAKILAAIAARGQYADTYRLGTVAPLAEAMLEHLRSHPEVVQASIAGSYRRRKETVHDLDFIVATRDPAGVTELFVSHDTVEEIIAKGPTKTSVRLKSGVQADLRVVSNEQYPFALVYFTGSKEHNVKIRGLALARGWTLNEYRMAPVEGKNAQPVPAIHEEADLHAALGLEYMEPELREDRGEVEAAAKRELPALVNLSNLRGTFHNHTTASDGRNSLEEMAGAARDLGLEYLGIADHSKSSFQAHGLDAKRLLAQGRGDPETQPDLRRRFPPFCRHGMRRDEGWHARFSRRSPGRTRLRRRLGAQCLQPPRGGDDGADHPGNLESLYHDAGSSDGAPLAKSRGICRRRAGGDRGRRGDRHMD